MDFDFDRVSMVVHQENRDRKFPPDHLRDLLRRELKGPVADDGDDAPVRRADRITESSGYGPSDRTPLHLDFEARASREIHAHSVEPGITRLDYECGIGGEKRL